MLQEFKSIFDLLKAFPTEQECIDHLTQLRWNGNVVSPFDETSKVYVCKGNKYKCKNTGKYFNVKTDTIFDDSKIPLQKWFMALYVFSSHKKGISSHQLAKDITVTQKTAWYMLHRLRYAFEHPEFRKIAGGDGEEFEADETYIGGKESNKHNSYHALKAKREAKVTGRGLDTKTPVLGLLHRGTGVLKMQVSKGAKRSDIHPFILKNVELGSTLITDQYPTYRSLKNVYIHESVNHYAKEYKRDNFHTNGIENAWSQLKRGIYGIYHHVSDGHLQRYCDEFTLRFNTRKLETAQRFDLILANVAGRKLTYQALITS